MPNPAAERGWTRDELYDRGRPRTLPRIEDMDVAGKRLLVRADLNVPVEQEWVTDATRIDRFAAGMRPLLARGARLVILTHYGRPDPAVREPGLSVERLCPALSEALGVPVRFAASCTGREAVALSAQLADGEAMLCENLRYDAGETANDPAFAAELANWATSMSTTPFPAPTGPMPRSWPSRRCCPRRPARCSRRNCRR